MEALETLFTHQSIRNYLDKEIELEKINNIKQAVSQCSSTCFYQLVTVIRVTDRSKISRIGEISGGTMKLGQAPELWFFCMDFTRLVKVGGLKMPIPFDLFFAGLNDTGICVEAALVAAESQGLSAVILGGFKSGLKEVCSILKLPKGAAPAVALCIGYGDDAYREAQKPRMPKSWTFMDNEYHDDFNEKDFLAYDEKMRSYYSSRKHNPRDMTWSADVSKRLSSQGALSKLIGVYEEQGFSFK